MSICERGVFMWKKRGLQRLQGRNVPDPLGDQQGGPWWLEPRKGRGTGLDLNLNGKGRWVCICLASICIGGLSRGGM